MAVRRCRRNACSRRDDGRIGLLVSASLPFRRNKRQQEIRRFAAAEVEAGDAGKDGGRPVAWVVVQEWPASFQFVLEIRQFAAARPTVFIILAAHAKADAIAG